MFILYADKTRLAVRQREPLTSGSVNACQIQFEFSEDWNGLTRIAVFRAGGKPVPMLLDGTNCCTIPWEVLEKPEIKLFCGVYGVRGSEMVLPTVWADLGWIAAGVRPGKKTWPPTPELWQQELASKGGALKCDGLSLSLMSGDKTLSTVQIMGGTIDHGLLSNRDGAEQHPIGSIIGLTEQLERIPDPAEPLSNEELEGLLE